LVQSDLFLVFCESILFFSIFGILVKKGDFMNLEQASKLVISFLKEGLNAEESEIEVKREEKSYYIQTTLYTKVVDDSILATYRLFENGVAVFAFVFDQLDKTNTSFKLLNDFNDQVTWFKAYVNDGNYLRLEHAAFEVSSPDELKEMLEFFHTKLVDEKTVKYLKPLTDLTN
jgi:hypothetical protein